MPERAWQDLAIDFFSAKECATFLVIVDYYNPSWNRDKDTKDIDAIRKIKGKIYADKKRGSKISDISEGDIVRIRNYEPGKIEPKWSKENFKVIKKVGNDTLVVSDQGVRYRRPVAHLSKIQTSSSIQEPTKNNDTNARVKDRKGKIGIPDTDEAKRPKRGHKLPVRYQ
uniref:Uncharacterized protein n=1 Tax=Anopheles epiroticus TaxID=199890 RepID=A0A182PX46_9DIPT